MLAAAGWGRMYGVWAKLNPGAIGSDQTIQVVFIRNIFGISLQLHSIGVEGIACFGNELQV